MHTNTDAHKQRCTQTPMHTNTDAHKHRANARHRRGRSARASTALSPQVKQANVSRVRYRATPHEKKGTMGDAYLLEEEL